MFRYMALIWDACNEQQSATATLLSARISTLSPDWQKVLSAEGLRVFCADSHRGASDVCPLAHNSGVIVGTLFARPRESHDPSVLGALSNLNAADTRRVLDTQGRQLISAYWGRYVAFLRDAVTHTKWVIKDPTGRLPCFHTTSDHVSVFFSSLSDCLRIVPGPFTINWPYIRRRVGITTGGARETALCEVSQLCGGERLEFRRDTRSKTLLWQPQDIAASGVIDNPVVAAKEMRSTVEACTQAWISGHDQVMIRLSGGLDSSIILGCAHRSRTPRKITCVTYHQSGGVSDERPWARLAVQHAGCGHVEHARHSRLNFQQLSRMVPLPFPPDDFSFIEFSELEQQLAREQQATAILSGDGGDAVFGSYAARFAAMDFFQRHGFDSGLLDIAANVALISHASVWSVLADALCSRFWIKQVRDNFEWCRDARRLVFEDVFTTAAAERPAHRHPWFASIETSSLSELLSSWELADPFYDPLCPPDQPGPEILFPLLSQPLIELCLRIPSYVHFEGGRDRGLARRAFSGVVPPEILARHWKDRVQGFTEEILFHARGFAREWLLDGILVKERLLDPREVDLALGGLRGKSAVSVGEIIDHLVTEAWLRAWVDVKSSHLTNATNAL